ncbi:MAG: hypothetical protein WD735_06605 [Balneolaceae bacterium]
MKFYSILFFSIFISFLLAGSAQSQDNSLSKTGSFYSGFGFGAPADVNSAYTMGMGLSGVSNFSNFSPNISNPAHWGVSGHTLGNVALGFTNFEASDRNASAESSMFGIENIQLTAPIIRNRLGVSFAFTPVSRSDYRRFTEESFEPLPGLDFDNVSYGTSITGNGGINRLELGAGGRIFRFLYAGYAFSVNLLSIEQEVSVFFPSDDIFSNQNYDKKMEGYEFGHRFGLFSTFPGVFRDGDQLAFGGTLNLPVTIDAEQSVESFKIINGRRSLVDINEDSPGRFGTLKMPLEFNAGLTYNLNRYSNFTAELLMQKWGDAEYSYDTEQQAYYKDRMKAGFGAQFHPYRSDQQRGFFSNFKYSIGTSFDTGHLAIENEDIETLLLHAGIGLFSPRSRSSIDLSFHYGIRGTESGNLVKEDIWGFKLSLNLAEFMFVRSRFQ